MYESYINKIEDVGKLRNLKPKTITLYQKNVSCADYRFYNDQFGGYFIKAGWDQDLLSDK